MDDVDALIPDAGREDMAALQGVGPDVLARYVTNRSHVWWRRVPCARALTGRVPGHHLDALVAAVQDPNEAVVVRIALLDTLSGHTALLPWLQDPDRAREASYGFPEAVLLARARLGDRTAVADLVTLANDPWRHRRTVADEALDALIARYGVRRILKDLDPTRPQDRSFALRHGGDAVAALADPDTGVAYLAHTLADDGRRLRALVDAAVDPSGRRRRPTVDTALWALCALHTLGVDITADYERLGRPRVEIDGLDEEVRAAIRGHFVPDSQPTTDPRWRVESICAADPGRYTGEASAWSSERSESEVARLERVTTALAAAGLAPAPPVPCGDHHGSGGGTYYVVPTANGTVDVCALGRFVTGDGADVPVAREALVAAGLRWIDAEIGTVRIDGLDVYYFGSRGPLTVGALLFYWQD